MLRAIDVLLGNRPTVKEMPLSPLKAGLVSILNTALPQILAGASPTDRARAAMMTGALRASLASLSDAQIREGLKLGRAVIDQLEAIDADDQKPDAEANGANADRGHDRVREDDVSHPLAGGV